jgi:hypothetical protein
MFQVLAELWLMVSQLIGVASDLVITARVTTTGMKKEAMEEAGITEADLISLADLAKKARKQDVQS